MDEKEVENKKRGKKNNGSDLSDIDVVLSVGYDIVDAVGTKGKEIVLDVAEGVSSVVGNIAENTGDLLEGAGDVAVGVGKAVGGIIEGVGSVLGDIDIDI